MMLGDKFQRAEALKQKIKAQAAKIDFYREHVTGVKSVKNKVFPIPKLNPINNIYRVSITKYGIFDDSFPEFHDPNLDRLTRLKAQTVIDLFIDEGPAKSALRIHGSVVNMSKQSGYNLLPVTKRCKSREMTCVCCGTKAKYAYLERRIVNGKPVGEYGFYYYSVDDNGFEIRMTVDHITPKAQGGRDNIANLQIMCQTCNEMKGSMDNATFLNIYKLLKTKAAL